MIWLVNICKRRKKKSELRKSKRLKIDIGRFPFVVEIVIPEVRGIDTDILLTIKDDILREKLLNANLLIANIEALKDNPTPSSDVMTKSSSTFPNSFLEETNIVDNSLPESETFCFNMEEISSDSTTTRSDYSLPDYEAFDFLKFN
ncbi:hypothetical protein Tco_0225803 [Tanacetum coccineum]